MERNWDRMFSFTSRALRNASHKRKDSSKDASECVASEGVAPHTAMSDAELVSRFESLGNNCEFGLLQRYCGLERLDLLRFNFTPLETLISGLNCSFSDLALEGQVTVSFENKQWMVRESVYGFYYHTYNRDPDYDPDRLLAQQIRWLRRMAAKFIEQVQVGDRIYVRKGEKSDQRDKIEALADALRRHGPATLLWATVADDTNAAESVKRVSDHLIKGHLKSFAHYQTATDFDVLPWLRLLRKTLALHSPNQGSVLETCPQNVISTHGSWVGAPHASTECLWQTPESPKAEQVWKHVLNAEASKSAHVFGWRCKDVLSAGDFCVAAVDIWLPQGFEYEKMGLVFIGQASLKQKMADRTISGAWQCIWVSARLASSNPVAFPRLFVVQSTPGAPFYSANWRVYTGWFPT
jgi:hypothetical protein